MESMCVLQIEINGGVSMMNFASRISIALVLSLILVTNAFAELASSKDTLRGHESVFVTVITPETDDAVRRLGLVKSSLERYLLDRLTQAEIPASSQFTNQTLILEVHVDIHRVVQSGNVDVFAFISRFDALQAVQLANRRAALATTWRATRFGAVTTVEADLLRDSVIKNVEQFIQDWTAAQSATGDGE